MKRAGVVGLAMIASMLGMGAMSSAAEPGKERAALMEADRAFGRESAARGLEGWLSCFADDATIFPPGAPIVTGLPAIREHYAKSGFSPQGLSWTPVAADVAASGDLGFTYGTWKAESAGPDGSTRTATGKYLTVWRKGPAGEWKVVADIGSADPP